MVRHGEYCMICRKIKKTFPFLEMREGVKRNAWDVDGWVRYRTLTSCGIKEEGEAYSRTYLTKREAVDAYIDELDKRLEPYDGNALLYWRIRPIIKKLDSKYVVYSRLIIMTKDEEIDD